VQVGIEKGKAPGRALYQTYGHSGQKAIAPIVSISSEGRRREVYKGAKKRRGRRGEGGGRGEKKN